MLKAVPRGMTVVYWLDNADRCITLSLNVYQRTTISEIIAIYRLSEYVHYSSRSARTICNTMYNCNDCPV